MKAAPFRWKPFWRRPRPQLSHTARNGVRQVHIDGRCHCGFVSYKAEIDPEWVSICHCKDCQRLTGTAYRVTVDVPHRAFEIHEWGAAALCEGRRQWPPLSDFPARSYD
ncbi:GFA family protein [Rhizobium sp. LEGMi12c]